MTSEAVSTMAVSGDVCPVCRGMHFVNDFTRGERVCNSCGCVVEVSLLDASAEPSFEGKDRFHYGAGENPLCHDKGLSTVISRSDRDFYGKSISYKDRGRFHRLRTLQRRCRVKNASERGMATAFAEIKRLCGIMDLPDSVSNDAAISYKKAMRKSLIHGRSINSVSAACVYAACRKNGVPRTLKEVAANTKISNHELGRVYRFLSRSLRWDLGFVKPQDYVSRFCSNLKVSPACQAETADIIRRYEATGHTSGVSPTGVVAAAIFLAGVVCNERRPKSAISETTGVTEVTIRKRANDISAALGISC